MQFRDACLDVATEFTKVGASWARANPEAAYKEVRNLNVVIRLQEAIGLQEATTRQSTLIARTQGNLQKRAADLKLHSDPS